MDFEMEEIGGIKEIRDGGTDIRPMQIVLVSIKKVKCNLFIEGNRFKTTNCTGTFEVDAKKLDLNACINGVSPKHRLKNHFIWIGILLHKSPTKLRCRNIVTVN